MSILKQVRQMACRHTYGWSERRQAEVCYKCGHVRAGSSAEPEGRLGRDR